MSLFGKEKPTKTIGIVDIGSGSVGAAISMLDHEGPPSMLVQTRVDTPITAQRSAEHIQNDVLQAASSALQQLTTQRVAEESRQGDAPFVKGRNPKHPMMQRVEHVAVFLPAPWSQLFLRTIRLSKSKPFTVSTSLVERMIADYVKREHPDENVEEVIERSAVGIKLNGYTVLDIPRHSEASSVELTVVSVTASKQFAAQVRSLIRDHFGHRITISFHATSIAASYALSVMRPQSSDYLICNGEGEVTELLLTNDHVPIASATAPQGCNMILRTLHVHADMARAEAASALELARTADSPMAQKLDATLSSAQKECAAGFEAAAQEITQQFGSPQTIYALGHGSEAQWYADAIANATFIKKLFPAGVSVEGIQYQSLATFLSHSEKVSSEAQTKKPAVTPTPTLVGLRSGDVFLALEAIFADSRFDERRSFNFKVT